MSHAMTNEINFDFSPAYTADGWASGIAWRATRFEMTDDEDTEWTGIQVRTGNIIAHMIGDDKDFSFTPDDLTPISDDDYCSCCGQVGCGWG